MRCILGIPAYSAGTSTFSAADAGRKVLISYGYIPADVSQCAVEWVAERWYAKDRVGVSSKSLGGQETVSYKNEDIPTFVALTLMQFKRVAPLDD